VWAAPVGNSWRTTGDIENTYESFVSILDKQVSLSRYSSIGAWNDPDMLEVGNGQMTNDEYQSHFSLWAALKAPLLIGCGLSGITAQTLKILGNE
jgi:alpha-galactosidase